jgi:hypothetical protein
VAYGNVSVRIDSVEGGEVKRQVRLAAEALGACVAYGEISIANVYFSTGNSQKASFLVHIPKAEKYDEESRRRRM